MIARRAVVAAGAFTLALGMLAAGCSPSPAADGVAAERGAQAVPLVPPGPRLRVVLMSSLPLAHGDGVDMQAVIAGRASPHPLYAALHAAHELVAADMLDDATLAGVQLVILVQPRALPPEALVALDNHVRAGGRLLLFADPALEWRGGFGLGDPMGPLRTSLMSPLLRHWGLELVDPGRESVRLAESGIVLTTPGQFEPLSGISGDDLCRVEKGGHVARCAVGVGHAILVADADLLDPASLGESAASAGANRRFIAQLIGDLTRRDTL